MADYVEFFTERDFKGVSQKLLGPSYPETLKYDLKDLSVAGGVGGGTISSLKMPSFEGWGFYVVYLYAKPGFDGAWKEFRGDAAYVGDDINDKTSSIVMWVNMREND